MIASTHREVFVHRCRHRAIQLAILLLCMPASAEPPTLTLLQELREGDGGLAILHAASAVAVSPDGDHVYATSPTPGVVVVLAAGDLAILGSAVDGESGVDGIAGAQALAVSPDGLHVYVTGEVADAVTAFARDPATGLLTFVEVERDGVGGTDGLAGARTVVVSPDGAHVIVSGLGEGALAVFARSAGTGELAFVERVSSGGVLSLAFVSSGEQLYAGSEGFFNELDGSGEGYGLAAYARNPATGALTLQWEIDPPRQDFSFLEQSVRVNGLALSDDDAFLYAALEGVNTGTGDLMTVGVAAMAREPAEGLLEQVDFEVLAGPDRGAAVVTLAGDGSALYLAGRTGGAHLPVPGATGELRVFTRDPLLGGLTAGETLTLAGPAGAAAEPGGARVFVAEAGRDAVSAFAPEAESGELALVARRDGGGVRGLRGASVVLLAPDGRFVHASGSEALTTFARDPASGELSFVRHHEGLSGRVVGSLGDQIYGLSRTRSQLLVLDRDPASGAVALAQVLENGVGGVTGLAAPVSLLVSPDGRFVYVSATGGIAVFERDFGAGVLVQRPGVATPAGPGGHLVATRSGAVVYLSTVSRLSSFLRAPFTGALTPIGSLTALPESEGPVALSTDDRDLYRLDLYRDLTLFRASDGTGLPVFQSTMPDVVPENSYPGLTLAPSGQAAYLSGPRLAGGAFSRLYERGPETGLLAPVSGVTPASEAPIVVTRNGTRAYGAADGAIFVYEAPEPTSGAGLVAAAVSLTGLARCRRRSASRRAAVR